MEIYLRYQRGSALNVLCRSFGKVYHGWWRGGSVAIKIVPHEGELGEKVDALRESLLCSAIQHPHIVRPLLYHMLSMLTLVGAGHCLLK